MRLFLHRWGRRFRLADAGTFKESEHPRGGKGSSKGGKFVRKGEGGGGAARGGKGGGAAPARGGGSGRGPEPEKGGGKGGGAAQTETEAVPTLTRTRQRAWSGEQKEGARLSKLEAGRLGEQIATAYIRSLGGDLKNARPLNTQQANFPIDLIGDHELYEVKTGQVSNSRSAQQWRATIGQPGKAETALMKQMSAEQLAAHNAKKQALILERKQKALDDYAKKFGRSVKGKTITLIIDPDREVADVHVFDGFHSRIAYRSDQAGKGYVGTFHYGSGKGRVGGDRAGDRRLRGGALPGDGPIFRERDAERMSDGFSWVDFIPESKQIFDKDGFLLCRDVPVARTGIQIYGPGETPIPCGDGGVVLIQRDAEEVFHPETLASLVGVPVVNDHPVDGEGNRCDVTPDNWRQLAVGHVENPRRGEGDTGDFVLADLRIHDRDAIDLIRSGKRQVSCGYDADYLEVSPGRGKQTKIRCNHMAIVDAARCGPVCAIADSTTTHDEEGDMSTWHERIRGLAKQYSFKARDQAELEAAIADAEEGDGDGATGPHVHVHLGNGRAHDQEEPDDKDKDKDKDTTDGKSRDLETEEVWQALEDLEHAIVIGGNGGDRKFKPRDSWPHRDARRRRMGIDARHRDQDPDKDKDKDKDETGDAGGSLGGGSTAILKELEFEAPAGAQVVDVRRVTDSRYLEESWTETASKGEIIIPGSRPRGTFDRAAPREQTYDAICGYRRSVLDMAFVQPEGRQIIENFTRGRFSGAKDLACGRVREIFDHVAEVKRVANNAGGHGTGDRVGFRPAMDAPFAAGGATNLAEYQKKLDEFYGAKR